MKLIATPHALLQSLLLPCCGASAGARGRDAQVLANAVDSDIFGREHPAELFLARVRATHKVGFHFLGGEVSRSPEFLEKRPGDQ